jgi:hypothetical protein
MISADPIGHVPPVRPLRGCVRENADGPRRGDGTARIPRKDVRDCDFSADALLPRPYERSYGPLQTFRVRSHERGLLEGFQNTVPLFVTVGCRSPYADGVGSSSPGSPAGAVQPRLG